MKLTPQEFQKQFQALIGEAMKSQVPMPHIMTCLTMAQAELGYLHSQSIQQMQMREMAKQMAEDAPKIVGGN